MGYPRGWEKRSQLERGGVGATFAFAFRSEVGKTSGHPATTPDNERRRLSVTRRVLNRFVDTHNMSTWKPQASAPTRQYYPILCSILYFPHPYMTYWIIYICPVNKNNWTILMIVWFYKRILRNTNTSKIYIYCNTVLKNLSKSTGSHPAVFIGKMVLNGSRNPPH